MPDHPPIDRAEILAVGSELLVGETRDTNSGDLAAELTDLGIEVTRIVLLPDDLEAVTTALSAARARADLVITSGGLGPTPDDLTREAIAAALGRFPEVDASIERWLRELWASRGIAFPTTNLKQAWLIPGAEALPNPHGTAPGWWVEAGPAVIVALPGPPRELLPMWHAHALPRLRARGVGVDRVAQTLRLTGIGEFAAADLLGPELLAGTRPHIATYARLDAVDVRVWATGDGDADARSLVDAGVAAVGRVLGPYVFASGQETWVEALAERLGGRRLATVEVGTAGQLAALLGVAPWLARAESLGPAERDVDRTARVADITARVAELRRGTDSQVGLGVLARTAGDDLAVDVVVDLAGEVATSSHSAFRGGDIGRRRAANIACAELWRRLAD